MLQMGSGRFGRHQNRFSCVFPVTKHSVLPVARTKDLDKTKKLMILHTSLSYTAFFEIPAPLWERSEALLAVFPHGHWHILDGSLFQNWNVMILKKKSDCNWTRKIYWTWYIQTLALLWNVEKIEQQMKKLSWIIWNTMPREIWTFWLRLQILLPSRYQISKC